MPTVLSTNDPRVILPEGTKVPEIIRDTMFVVIDQQGYIWVTKGLPTTTEGR
jgi:hypothetical protein